MINTLAESEILSDGSGKWTIHLDRDGMPLCGKNAVLMRSSESAEVNCERCLTIATLSVPFFASAVGPACGMASLDPIDFVIGIYGWANDIVSQTALCLSSLYATCNMTGVNLVCVERTCQPISSELASVIRHNGGVLKSCPLPPYNNCLEDTAQFCNWMVDNSGDSPWVVISHFDVVFKGDYIRYLRSFMCVADMIGNHHDGVVAVSRKAYSKCGVGFCGIDGASMCVVYDANLPRIISGSMPKHAAPVRKYMLALDVGELLALRISSLGLRHEWLLGGPNGTHVGKSAFFTHARMGSGHS